MINFGVGIPIYAFCGRQSRRNLTRIYRLTSSFFILFRMEMYSLSMNTEHWASSFCLNFGCRSISIYVNMWIRFVVELWTASYPVGTIYYETYKQHVALISTLFFPSFCIIPKCILFTQTFGFRFFFFQLHCCRSFSELDSFFHSAKQMIVKAK